MNQKPLYRIAMLVTALLVCCAALVEAQPAPTDLTPSDDLYGTASWNADSLGNHRVVLKVTQISDAVVARIPWRRRDLRPEEKGIVIIDASTEKKVANAHWITVNREFGDVVFQPPTVPGEYYVYYLMYRAKGSKNYPKGTYLSPERTADNVWPSRFGLPQLKNASDLLRSLPQASVIQFQSIDSLNSFYPMEVIATRQEVEDLLKSHKDAEYLLFPEDRDHSIRMTADLPYRWIQRGPQQRIVLEAKKGEFISFQVGLVPIQRNVEDVYIRMGDLKGAAGSLIRSSAFSTFNTDGIDWKGNRFHKKTSVRRESVQAFWMGIQVPPESKPGTYEGEIVIEPSGMSKSSVRIELIVTPQKAIAGGDNEPARLSRLRWLDSQLAADDETVPRFPALGVKGRTVSCLGRSVTLNQYGFPDKLTSYFSPEVTRITTTGREILAQPVNLVVERVDGKDAEWGGGDLHFTKKAPGVVSWKSRSRVGPFDVSLVGRMESDGFVDFEVTLEARESASVKDVRLEVPIVADAARYMMGLGAKGGFRPKEFEWKWNVQYNQDAVWLGDVNAGVQVSLRDENYVRPLNTNFYLLKPLHMPPSWYNEGRGGIHVHREEQGRVLLRAFSGVRSVRQGEKLHFNCSLLLTPFRSLNTNGQWNTRYYHRFVPIKDVADAGANTINVHHATDINPYINYPFLRPAEMKSYVDEGHRAGFKVKIYYTVRELTNRAPELFMLRSLGDEVLSYGPGGGFSWLQEHLDSSYIAAWFVPELKDAAVINSGVSRWHNFYVEGLRWLVRNVGIDGIYIDDVAFDRATMKRVRKVLDRNRPGALIDLHSANQYNPRDGFANSANLYLEHFPYIDRLWFGEYFDYNSSPDFWLIEVSGIPFGLMGEMLEKGGNPWRGMIYGMTSRLPWAGDPSPVWALWDEFGMQKSEMIGYWSPSCPVKTDQPNVLATAYLKPGKALVAIASWDPNPVNCSLLIDWKALGMNPSKAVITASAAKDFQPAATFRVDEKIPVQPGKGWLLVVDEKR
jgi:hypothetical protein